MGCAMAYRAAHVVVAAVGSQSRSKGGQGKLARLQVQAAEAEA
jgi:hypothetical protein